jgi:hypothetical protein
METQENQAQAEPQKKKDTVVDAIVDVVTARAAQGLEKAKLALEAAARWLDERAKRVGELGVKIAPKKAPSPEEKPA